MNTDTIIDNLAVTEGTKRNYRYKYKNVIELGINMYEEEDVILNKLLKQTISYNNMSEYINIIIVLRRELDLSIKELVSYRDTRRKDNVGRETDTNKANEEKGLPSLEKIQEYIIDLYTAKEYKKYIINYLLILTNCRNKDLDLFITYDNPDVTNNWLVITDESVTFIRNDYKTVGSYGSKKNVITDPAFIYATKQVGPGSLLKTKNHNAEIQDATFEKLGQGRYFKIVTQQANVKELKELSTNRGTSIGTIVNFYS